MTFNRIEYIIPSYKRANLLCKTTLKLLEAGGIDEVSLYINKTELNDYKETIEKYNYKIRVIYKTIDFDGIGKIRNYIRKIYPSGTNLLMIDDDIDEILIKENNVLVPLKNIKKFNEEMFKKAEENNVYLWGVQLHTNPFYMNKKYQIGLSYINGSWTGHRIDHSLKKIETNLDHFEDYLFSILHFIRDRNVLKASQVALKTKCFNAIGGICQQKRGFDKRREEASLNGYRLKSHFDELLYLTVSKKFGVANIRFKNIKWHSDLEKHWESYENYNELHNKYFEPKAIVGSELTF